MGKRKTAVLRGTVVAIVGGLPLLHPLPLQPLLRRQKRVPRKPGVDGRGPYVTSTNVPLGHGEGKEEMAKT